MNSDNPEFLTRPQAADYIREKCRRCSKNTLAKLATIGGGPIYQIFGGLALYTRRNLDIWIEEKLSAPMRSTSERAAPKAPDDSPNAGISSRNKNVVSTGRRAK